MQLEILRDQKDEKGWLGGHKGVTFIFEARAKLTPEEQELIERYKAGNMILARYQLPMKHSNDTLDFSVSINDLLKGKTVTTQDIGILIQLEEKVKEGCQFLKQYLDVMRTFGGKEVIEI